MGFGKIPQKAVNKKKLSPPFGHYAVAVFF